MKDQALLDLDADPHNWLFLEPRLLDDIDVARRAFRRWCESEETTGRWPLERAAKSVKDDRLFAEDVLRRQGSSFADLSPRLRADGELLDLALLTAPWILRDAHPRLWTVARFVKGGNSACARFRGEVWLDDDTDAERVVRAAPLYAGQLLSARLCDDEEFMTRMIHESHYVYIFASERVRRLEPLARFMAQTGYIDKIPEGLTELLLAEAVEAMPRRATFQNYRIVAGFLSKIPVRDAVRCIAVQPYSASPALQRERELWSSEELVETLREHFDVVVRFNAALTGEKLGGRFALRRLDNNFVGQFFCALLDEERHLETWIRLVNRATGEEVSPHCAVKELVHASPGLVELEVTALTPEGHARIFHGRGCFA